MSSGVGQKQSRRRSQDDRERVVSLRALAHPVRLQILSLLTGTALSAAEVARELGLTHANASYHLRQLRAARQLVEAGEETIRGGHAKRYRYDVDAPGGSAADADVRAVFFRVLAGELVRRSAALHPTGRQTSSDAELWVADADWAIALDHVNQALSHLHRVAVAQRTPGALHVSATVSLFEMADRPGGAGV